MTKDVRGARPKMSEEQLNAQLADYMLKDESRAKSFLNADLEEYAAAGARAKAAAKAAAQAAADAVAAASIPQDGGEADQE